MIDVCPGKVRPLSQASQRSIVAGFLSPFPGTNPCLASSQAAAVSVLLSLGRRRLVDSQPVSQAEWRSTALRTAGTRRPTGINHARRSGSCIPMNTGRLRLTPAGLHRGDAAGRPLARGATHEVFGVLLRCSPGCSCVESALSPFWGCVVANQSFTTLGMAG